MKPIDDNPEVSKLLREIAEHLCAIRDAAHPSETLTIEEAATELRASADTVLALIKTGQLRAAEIRTGRGRGLRTMYRIRREWIDEFLSQQATKAHMENSTPANTLSETADFIGDSDLPES